MLTIQPFSRPPLPAKPILPPRPFYALIRLRWYEHGSLVNDDTSPADARQKRLAQGFSKEAVLQRRAEWVRSYQKRGYAYRNIEVDAGGTNVECQLWRLIEQDEDGSDLYEFVRLKLVQM